jgi:hypothetical protein
MSRNDYALRLSEIRSPDLHLQTYAGDTVYGLNEFDEVDWNTGNPSCEPAVLRPGYSIREIMFRYEPWLPYGHPFYSPKVKSESRHTPRCARMHANSM